MTNEMDILFPLPDGRRNADDMGMPSDPMHEVHYWRKKATEADSEVRSLREQLMRANAALQLAGAGIITPDEDEVAKKLAAQLVAAREDSESLRHMLNVACADLDASRAEVAKFRALLQEASDDWIPHYAVLSAAIIDALRGRGNAEETNEVRPVEARDATDEP